MSLIFPQYGGARTINTVTPQPYRTQRPASTQRPPTTTPPPRPFGNQNGMNRPFAGINPNGDFNTTYSSGSWNVPPSMGGFPTQEVSGDPRGAYASMSPRARPPAFQMSAAQTPWGQSMDPFRERDALIERLNSQRMDRQMAFNSFGNTNPFASQSPWMNSQRAMQDAGLFNGSPSMNSDYGQSFVGQFGQPAAPQSMLPRMGQAQQISPSVVDPYGPTDLGDWSRQGDAFRPTDPGDWSRQTDAFRPTDTGDWSRRNAPQLASNASGVRMSDRYSGPMDPQQAYQDGAQFGGAHGGNEAYWRANTNNFYSPEMQGWLGGMSDSNRRAHTMMSGLPQDHVDRLSRPRRLVNGRWM